MINQLRKNITIETDLKQLYRKCNELFFDGDLQDDIKVEFSNRMTRVMGTCYWKKKGNEYKAFRVALSKPFHEAYEEEILDTLLHEMIHVQFPKDGHGKKFQNRCKELNDLLGTDLKMYSDISNPLKNARKYKWNYQCVGCGRNHIQKNRNKNINRYSCGSCRGDLKELTLTKEQDLEYNKR